MKSHISTIHKDSAQQRTVLLWGRDCSAGLDVHINTFLKMISLDSMLTRKFSGSSFDRSQGSSITFIREVILISLIYFFLITHLKMYKE